MKTNGKAPPIRIRTKGLSWVRARRSGGRARPAGWLARVPWRGLLHSKWFGAVQHGGKLAAMKAAAAWVRRTERELHKPSTSLPVRALSTHNKSGVIGVAEVRKGGARVFVVTWPAGPPGKQKRTSVSIQKYGRQEAWRRAVAIRKRAEREWYGRALPPLKPEKRA